MDPELLMQLLSDPEMMDQLAQMGAYQEQMGLAGQQARRAEGLRATPMAEGRTVGHTYVAASPLEHLAAGMQRMRGERELAGATGRQQGLVGQDIGARRGLAGAMAEAMRRARQPTDRLRYAPPVEIPDDSPYTW